MINLVTVCTESYPLIYAEKLHTRFANLTNLDVAHFCITDRPKEIGNWAEPLFPSKMSKGWWNKLNLFDPNMPDGKILYLDLDIVVIKNFDEEIQYMVNNSCSMNCVSDAVHWMGEKFSSSMMLFDSGAHYHIFDAFLRADPSLTERPGGDQVWVGPQLSDINYIDEKYPDLKKNLKFHLSKREGNKLLLPKALHPSVKLVDCGGRPKPDELAFLPFIKNNWHDVEVSQNTRNMSY